MSESPHEAYAEQTAATVRADRDAIRAIAAGLGLDEKEVHEALNEVHGKTLVKNVLAEAFQAASGEPLEDADEEGGTGVEKEDLDGDRRLRPYDPDKIRVDPKPFSLKQILDDIEAKDIDLAPDFQRNRVWSDRQRVRLVESVLLRIPLPAFYFSAAPDGILSVVDGLQRLSTIQSFVTGGFSLTKKDLEYLDIPALKPGAKPGDEKCSFNELSPQWRRRLHQTQITANVIDPQTPEQVKFDIFKRINTGGSPLNAQEIRHSMMRARSRDVLKRLTASRSFYEATPRTLHRHRRMADREVVLRFLAFALLGDFNAYPADSTMDAFLMDAVRDLDDPREVSDARLAGLEADFERAMRNAATIFGEHSFRKWPLGKDRLFPFNKALFESWGFALREADPARVAKAAKAIQKTAREVMAERAYNDSVTISTGDVNSVKRRFEAATRIVQGSL